MSPMQESEVLGTRTGLEDVVRSLRDLTRTSRSVAVTGTEVMERELAMAITISEQIRDDVISKSALEEMRDSSTIAGRLREDAHRAVDLVADAATLAARSGVRFAELFADTPRPALASAPA
jgi:hypothetical protein